MPHPERWQAYLIGLLVLASGVIAYQVLPEYARQKTLHEALRQQQAQKNSHWKSVLPLQKSVSALQNVAHTVTPFSPVDFQHQHAELMSWTPDGRGGEMTLETIWSQVPSTFARLAERGMRVTAFSVQPGAARLVLTLQLEGGNEK